MLAKRFLWLDPIHRTGRAMDLLSAYDLSKVDVLGLSCYTWNFELQCEIAAALKAVKPDVPVVAGGPRPAENRADFFRQHACIDVVVRQDGELTFNRLLRSICLQITRNADEELMREHVVFQNKGFTSDEWAAMNVYASFVRALHCHSLTRLIAVYLYATHGISYRDFYETLIEGFFRNVYDDGHLLADIDEHYRSALITDGVLDECDLSGLLGFPRALSVARSIIVRLSLDVDVLFDQLGDFLVERFASAGNLRSIIQFQRNVLIPPSYDATVGRAFEADHDWPSYFSLALRRSGRGTVGEPAPLAAATIFANDTICGEAGLMRSIDWSGWKGDDRLRAWMTRIVCGRMSVASSNLRSLAVRFGDAVTENPIPLMEHV